MDVDIDFPTSFDPLDIFKTATRASRVQDGELKKHNAGIYFQNIPVDHQTGFAAIPFKQAQEMDYFKIDFLHLSFLDNFGSKREIRALLQKEPDWLLMQSPEVISKLFQIHNHIETVQRIKPQSTQELADCIAIIRPGKRYLLEAYLKDRNAVRPHLYTKPEDGRAYFKKPHAISYALTIILQLHLIKAGIL